MVYPRIPSQPGRPRAVGRHGPMSVAAGEVGFGRSRVGTRRPSRSRRRRVRAKPARGLCSPKRDEPSLVGVGPDASSRFPESSASARRVVGGTRAADRVIRCRAANGRGRNGTYRFQPANRARRVEPLATAANYTARQTLAAGSKSGCCRETAGDGEPFGHSLTNSHRDTRGAGAFADRCSQSGGALRRFCAVFSTCGDSTQAAGAGPHGNQTV